MFPINDELVEKLKVILKEDAGEEVFESRMFHNVSLRTGVNELAFYFNPNKLVIQRVEVNKKRTGVLTKLIKAIEDSGRFDVIVMENAITDESKAFCESTRFTKCTIYDYNYNKKINNEILEHD